MNDGRGMIGLLFMVPAGVGAYWLSLQVFGDGEAGRTGRVAVTCAGVIVGLVICVLYLNEALPKFFQVALNIVFGLIALGLVLGVIFAVVNGMVK